MSSSSRSSAKDSNSGTTLGLDVGTAKVGIASARAGCVLPLETVPRAKGQAEQRILELIEQEQVKTIVVGLPLDEDGNDNPECELIRKFCRRISKRAKVAMVFIDEYGSSAEAKQRLGKSALTEAGAIDAVAASVILQSYLDGEQVVSVQS